MTKGGMSMARELVPGWKRAAVELVLGLALIAGGLSPTLETESASPWDYTILTVRDRIGIGTEEPQKLLHITSFQGGYEGLGIALDPHGGGFVGGTRWDIDNTSGVFQVVEHATCSPDFLDNPRLVMVGNCLGSPYGGNVGIGVTDPGSTLDVGGDLTVRGKSLAVVGGPGSQIEVGMPETGYSTSLSYEYDPESGMFDTYLRNPCGRGVGCDLILDFPYGNVGVGTATPHSTLQIDGAPGYLQIDVLPESPPDENCDEQAEVGRMVLQDPDYLWVCTGEGWKSSNLE